MPSDFSAGDRWQYLATFIIIAIGFYLAMPLRLKRLSSCPQVVVICLVLLVRFRNYHPWPDEIRHRGSGCILDSRYRIIFGSEMTNR